MTAIGLGFRPRTMATTPQRHPGVNWLCAEGIRARSPRHGALCRSGERFPLALPSEAVKGTVRISASEIMGAEVLPPMLAELRRNHPTLEFELALSNTLDNLLRRDADIAVRMVEPAQEALVVKKLGTVSLGLHAHKDYLARTCAPTGFSDLAEHSLIGFDRETPAIRGMRSRVPGADALRFSFRADSDIAQLRAIKAGFGIGICQVGLAKQNPDLVRLCQKPSNSSSVSGSPCMKIYAPPPAAALYSMAWRPALQNI